MPVYRGDLTATGREVRFVTCLVPERVENLQVRAVAPDVWEATWAGGSERFAWPPEIAAVPDAEPVADVQPDLEADTTDDLEEAPFALLDEPDAALLAALDAPPVSVWRRTGAAMQTLVTRGNAAALPKIAALLADARQNYTVHAVAAGCLGRARYAPARELLQQVAHLPEVNTASRARWALARLAPPAD
jgi:hypothetical protein